MGSTSVSCSPAERLGVEEASNLDWTDGVETSWWGCVLMPCPRFSPGTCPVWFIREIAKLRKLEEMSRPVSCLQSKWHLKQSGTVTIYLSLLRERAVQVQSIVFLHWGCIWEVIPSANFVIQTRFLLVCSGSVLHVVTNCYTACGKWPRGWACWDGHSLSERHSLFLSSLVSPQVSRHSSPLTSSHPVPSPHPLSIAVIPKLERACIRITWTIY